MSKNWHTWNPILHTIRGLYDLYIIGSIVEGRMGVGRIRRQLVQDPLQVLLLLVGLLRRDEVLPVAHRAHRLRWVVRRAARRPVDLRIQVEVRFRLLH